MSAVLRLNMRVCVVIGMSLLILQPVHEETGMLELQGMILRLHLLIDLEICFRKTQHLSLSLWILTRVD